MYTMNPTITLDIYDSNSFKNGFRAASRFPLISLEWIIKKTLEAFKFSFAIIRVEEATKIELVVNVI